MNKSLFLLSILCTLSACSPKVEENVRQPENNQVEVISAEIVDKSRENADKSDEKDAFGIALADDSAVDIILVPDIVNFPLLVTHRAFAPLAFVVIVPPITFNSPP